MTAALTSHDFEHFYRALHGYDPFPWQTRLAESVCSGKWPTLLDLPTATGKTSCIDIAVFAIAVRQRGPRRVFFVIDRRVVVDQAYEHMKEIARKLSASKSGILLQVKECLVQMGGSPTEPVAAYQMRGGIYRDDSWVQSPLQPLLIASTVDQVGSRLLFRGYGASDKTWPLHAAMVANDSLIVLDEAHCSRPFAQTLSLIAGYCGPAWAEKDLGFPLTFVEMTATPADSAAERFQLNQEDDANQRLRPRLFAAKPAKLVTIKAKAKDHDKIAAVLVQHAIELALKPGFRRIAIMVNRVNTARLVHALLKAVGRQACLLIGRMRPIDRETLPPEVEGMQSGKPRKLEADPFFVVATQCLEVGADLDFDGLVTECASIDALLQRFGRLDRTGAALAAGIQPEGRIVACEPLPDKDAVYQEALARTWRWLTSLGESVDFGIRSAAGTATVRERLRDLGQAADNLRRASAPTPILLPAHLDLFVQTFPQPALEPDPHVFLHGKENTSPEVQVVWRMDLDPSQAAVWTDIVALCPPVTMEAMPVPLAEFRRWITGSDRNLSGSDIESGDVEDEAPPRKKDFEVLFPVLRWIGDQSELLDPQGGSEFRSANRIRPGDTLILSEQSRGWNELGHIPGDEIDCTERARNQLNRGWIVRLLPELIAKRWPETDFRAKLIAFARDPMADESEVAALLAEYRESLAEGHWLRNVLAKIPTRPKMEMYPLSEGRHVGWVVTKPYVEADFGQDEGSASVEVSLQRHLADVEKVVCEFGGSVIADKQVRTSLANAAKAHDWGKADVRFQALLRGGDVLAAQLAPVSLAKGKQSKLGPRLRKQQWQRTGLPIGFRHELVSLSLIRQDSKLASDDLMLHLVASHHGRCRPFAPVVGGEKEIEWDGKRLTRDDLIALAAHRLDSGVPETLLEVDPALRLVGTYIPRNAAQARRLESEQG